MTTMPATSKLLNFPLARALLFYYETAAWADYQHAKRVDTVRQAIYSIPSFRG